MSAREPLAEYHRKRRFAATPEPRGEASPPAGTPESGSLGGSFVVQKHRARALHYDFRLELGGVLKSWAVPKGPSLDPAVKRLAVEVEDHPLEYASFEGLIPEGNYGAGEVIVWDRGTWTWSPSDETRRRSGTAARALERGKLDVALEGEKLSGRFVLARGRRGEGRPSWMLLKVRDASARPGSDVARERPESLISGRTIEALRASPRPDEARWSSTAGLLPPTGSARGPASPEARVVEVRRSASGGARDEGPRPRFTNAKKVFFPREGITKGEVALHYERVAPVLLPHLRDRPMVLVRYPDGIDGGAFYQKNVGIEAPDWAHTVTIWPRESRRNVRYLVVDRAGELAYCVQLGAISLSPWSSRIGTLDEPDFSILDLDPGEGCTFEMVVAVAREVKRALEEIGLRGYPKTSGATGIHVGVPLASGYSYDDARLLAQIVATLVTERRPELCTLVRPLAERPRDRVYVDYLQNAVGKTVVCAYSVRERDGAPVSTPLRWSEVRRGLSPLDFPLRAFEKRLAAVGDLWRPVLEDGQRIEAALAKLETRVARRAKGGRARRAA